MVITADKTRTDGVAFEFLNQVPTNIPILLLSRSENLDFNEKVLELAGKPFVVADYIEAGWDNPMTETLIVGQNTAHFGDVCQKGYERLNEFLSQNKPILYFKRELLKKDKTDWLKPIDYASNISPVPIQSESEFNSRPISAAYYFGRSHEGRLAAHASIWRGASQYGYSVCDNVYYFNGFMQHEAGKKYVSMHIPHYQRHQIQDIVTINGMAKIGIVPHGAGIKTFRASEVSANAVMLMWEDNLAWSYEWVHGVNCLRCNPGEEVETIEKWTQDERLYSIYCEGVKTWGKYRSQRYVSEYIIPLIEKNGSTQ